MSTVRTDIRDADGDLTVSAVTIDTDALLLDLDGTLIDSTESIERCWRQWAAEFEVDTARLLAVHHGHTTAHTVAEFVSPERVDEAVARMTELELADVHAVRPLPGAVELVTGLPPGRWAIVTSGSVAIAASRTQAVGLPTAPVTVTADDVARGKPDPEPYLLAASRLGVHPSRCLVVEDAPSGVASARAAGMAVVGVTSSHGSDALDVDLLVESPARLQVIGSGPMRVSVRP